ncbi:neutrophil cytosol factor 4 [Pristis pectinata]|uniref:neutrophil cytosol factor 4 n=1 Tax=Pristis pectinata TaxID=685728 RepID=UPI00223E2C72|nr:neutrophil cytosol factor 4 [Pristis pectinata]
MNRQLRGESDYEQLPDDVPVSAYVADVQQGKGISAFFLFVIQVKMKGGGRYFIFRRYRQFHSLQMKLKGKFDPENNKSFNICVLPELPGKVYLGNKQEIAEKRIPELNMYMKKLLSLPAWILLDEDLRIFFYQTPEDSVQIPKSLRRLRPPTRKVQTKTTKGVTSTKAEAPRAEALYNFTGESDLELTFKAGDIIYLLKKVNEDWLEGIHRGCSGIFPKSFVRIIEDLSQGFPTASEEGSTTVHRLRCVYHDVHCSEIRDIYLGSGISLQPEYSFLLSLMRTEFANEAIALNYRDPEGDLVRIMDNMDVELMALEAEEKPRVTKPDFVPWQLHVTREEDLSVYNTQP